MFISFALAILIPALNGYYLLRGFGLRFESMLLKICLSLGIGIGVSSIIHFIIMLFSISQPITMFIEGIVCLLLIGLVEFGPPDKVGITLTSHQKIMNGGIKRWTNILTFIFVLISLIILGTSILVSVQNPHGGWDAWAIWNQHARFLFRSGVNWQLNYVAQNEWSHPDYPFFLPVTIVRIWRFIGIETTFVPVFVSILFFFLTITTIYSSLTYFRSKFWGVIGALLLLGAPGFVLQGISQYADIPLSFYFLLTWVFVAICTQQETAASWVLAGIVVGLSTLVKNEGLLFAFLFLTGFFVLNWLRQTFKQRTVYFSFATGFLTIFAFTLYFKLFLAPQNDLIAENNLVTILQSLGNPLRYGQIGSAFMQSAINYFDVPLIIFPLLWLFLGIERQRFKQPVIGLSLFTLIFMLVGYFFVYVTTPYNLEWHLKTSLSRLFIHLWPSLVFISILMVQELKQNNQIP